MPSPESLRRLANLTREVRNDLRRGGMGVTFRYLFRANAILARVVEILADHVATQAEEAEAEKKREEAAGRATGRPAGASRDEEARVAREIQGLEKAAQQLARPDHARGGRADDE